jgi:hypothetical protein
MADSAERRGRPLLPGRECYGVTQSRTAQTVEGHHRAPPCAVGVLPRLGDVAIDHVDAQSVAALVADLHAAGLKKQTIRKTVSVLAMVLNHARVEPNPVRDRLTLRLPREERRHVEPRTAENVEAVIRLLPPTAGPRS